MEKNRKYFAFTLAETLLTLVVIGVIAALTTPALKDHSEEAKFVALTKQAYANISAATTAVEAQYGDVELIPFGVTNDKWGANQDTVKKYRSVMNSLMDTKNASWDRNTLDGENNYSFKPNIITADGMAWSIGSGGYPCGGGCANVDVNGPEPPNIIGIDQHGFRIGTLCDDKNKKASDFGVYPMGDGVHDKNSGWSCTAYVIKHGKMPWLKGGYSNCDNLTGK